MPDATDDDADHTPPTPDTILGVGMGFFAAKALLSAVELGVFTTLADGARDAASLLEVLGLQPRGSVDWLDALVSLGLLDRTDDRYSNTAETDLYLDRRKPSYVGGVLEMANERLYPLWGSLTEALRTGQPQNEATGDDDVFARLYSDPDRLRGFLQGMTGASIGAAVELARQFPWEEYGSAVDIGTAQGCVPVQLALRHPHLDVGGFDLPPVRPVFEEYANEHDLSDRVAFHAGDFFRDPLPSADVLVLGRILHDWDLAQKLLLLRKAYDAIPAGGAVVVYDAMIDDERRSSTSALLTSVNMLLETSGGFDYTFADCRRWMTQVGFASTTTGHLAGLDAMVVGRK